MNKHYGFILVLNHFKRNIFLYNVHVYNKCVGVWETAWVCVFVYVYVSECVSVCVPVIACVYIGRWYMRCDVWVYLTLKTNMKIKHDFHLDYTKNWHIENANILLSWHNILNSIWSFLCSWEKHLDCFWFLVSAFICLESNVKWEKHGCGDVVVLKIEEESIRENYHL